MSERSLVPKLGVSGRLAAAFQDNALTPLLAPGKGISTLAIVTLICGSSSRGVTSTANRPSRKAISAMSGVICERWNRAAIFPEMPIRLYLQE